MFADFLVTYTPHVSHVVFQYVKCRIHAALSDDCSHASLSPKLIPWFVSDVTPADFSDLVTSLSNPSFFPAPPSSPSDPQAEPASVAHLEQMVQRWQRHLADGTFTLSVPRETPLGPKGDGHEGAAEKAGFWTMPWACWDMKDHAPALWEYLSGSGLVIFKVLFASMIEGIRALTCTVCLGRSPVRFSSTQLLEPSTNT